MYENLSDFFDYNRPVVTDMCIIIFYVMEMLQHTAEKNDILFHCEYIFYDRMNRKVRFSQYKDYNKNAEKQVNELLTLFCNMTKYAGSDVTGFTRMCSDIYLTEGAAKCYKTLKRYVSEIDRANEIITVYNVLFVIVIAAMEMFFYNIRGILFYG